MLEKRQLNAEGAIERLVNNQELLISLFASIIAENQLKSQVYIENQNIIIITDPNDIRWLKSIDTEKNRSIDASEVVVESNVFEEYHNYVKKMRRND